VVQAHRQLADLQRGVGRQPHGRRQGPPQDLDLARRTNPLELGPRQRGLREEHVGNGGDTHLLTPPGGLEVERRLPHGGLGRLQLGAALQVPVVRGLHREDLRMVAQL
jgi:hypothetical protein